MLGQLALIPDFFVLIKESEDDNSSDSGKYFYSFGYLRHCGRWKLGAETQVVESSTHKFRRLAKFANLFFVY